MNLLIDYQCPQCGAPAIIEETDRLFSCQYCRVKSYLYHPDTFQYVLPNKAPDKTRLFFIPYWRFKGTVFSCIDKSIEYKFLDISQQAIKSELFPASVGLRSQALKLKFVTPDMPGYFVKPELTLRHAMDTLSNRFPFPDGQTVQHQAHIGETISLIYSPFYADNKLVDAVINKVVKPKLPDDFNIKNLSGGAPEWSLDFIPTLCPHCGWDLQGERDTIALTCKNCVSVWVPSKNRLKRINFECLPGSDTHVYFPFWKIKAEVSKISLRSYADLVRTANLPKAIQKGWEDIDFYFWVPGFKVRPKTFLRLLHQTTTAQPLDEFKKQLPGNNLFPPNLPFEEAVESLKINLAGFVKNDTFLENLSQVKIKPQNLLLAFIPFEEGTHEFIQPRYHLSINKNQLALAANL